MNPDPPPFHLGYRRSLDGIRGVAILFVVLVHDGIIRDTFGFIGINTFFVLSGFLITCLLVEEWDMSHDIRFREFYVRRALRLLPALIIMLIAFVVFAFFFDPRRKAIREFYEALRALFYFTNWARIFRIGRTVTLVHTWSLSVEEQFYFTWPFILYFLLRKTSRTSLACWIFLGAFLSAVLRIGLFVGGTESIGGNVFAGVNLERLHSGSDTRADSLLLGCFFGVLVSSNLLPRQRWFASLLKILAMVSVPGLLAMGTLSFLEARMICVGWFLASIFAAILIVYLVTASGSLFHRILENPPLVFVGKISYGLYLWNYPMLMVMQQHHYPVWNNLGFPWQNLIQLIPVFGAVIASYYLIERPCLQLKKRFQITE
jgi:peptidoglycan/LPS O-acetylase OafA/YrhL